MLRIPSYWVLIGMLALWLPLHVFIWIGNWKRRRAEREDGRPHGHSSWIEITVVFLILVGALLLFNPGPYYYTSTIIVWLHVILILFGVAGAINNWRIGRRKRESGENVEAREESAKTAYLIDLPLDEIVASPATTRERWSDARVIPSAMEQYVRIAGSVPIWPEVDHDGTDFFTLNGGAHVRAAQAASVANGVRRAYRGRTEPLQVRCIYRGSLDRLPPEQAARLRRVEDIEQAMADEEDRAMEPSWHVLSFELPLSHEQKAIVVAEVVRFAAWARKEGYRRYGEVLNPEWFEDRAFAWRVFMNPNPGSRQVMHGVIGMMERIKAANIPLVASNGYRVLSTWRDLLSRDKQAAPQAELKNQLDRGAVGVYLGTTAVLVSSFAAWQWRFSPVSRGAWLVGIFLVFLVPFLTLLGYRQWRDWRTARGQKQDHDA